MELVNAIIDNLRQRLTNPLLGAFATIWAVYNSTFIYYLFMADYPVDQKLPQLKILYNQSYFSATSGYWYNSLVPLVWAIVYVLASPWVQYFVQLGQDKAIKLRVDARAKREESRLDSEKEVVRRKAQHQQIAEFVKLEEEEKLVQKRLGVLNLQKEEEELKAFVAPESCGEVSEKEEKLESNASGHSGEVETMARSPHHLKVFKSIHKLNNLSNKRIGELMDYVDFKINDADQLKMTSQNKQAIVNGFIQRVDTLDRLCVSMKVPQDKMIAINVIERLYTFELENKYPATEEDWVHVLTNGWPDFSNSRLKEIMNEAARSS